MTQSRQSSNLLVRLLGSAALVGLVGIVALGWSIYSSQSQEKAMERQLSNQATQIAKQDIQIALNAEQNRLLSVKATAEANQATIEAQRRTPPPSDRTDFAPTATALAAQSAQVEATRQAIEIRQKQIEATQTAIARPPASAIAIRASDVIPQLKGEDGEIERILNWWRVDDWGNTNGQLNPSSLVSGETCFGLAWNTNEFGDLRLIVFQKPRAFTFATGGWYVKVCTPKSIQISPEDMGKIQADWLSKRYGTGNDPWEVIIDK